MYALQIPGQMKFLRKEGGYCDLTTPHEIQWFNHYLTATEAIQKLDPRSGLMPIESRDLLLMLATNLNRLSPEIIQLVKELETKELSDEDLFLHIDTSIRLAAMRGGMEEMRQRRAEDQKEIAQLKQERDLQKQELEKLMVALRDYERIVQQSAE
jgi:hypothetical protein